MLVMQAFDMAVAAWKTGFLGTQFDPVYLDYDLQSPLPKRVLESDPVYFMGGLRCFTLYCRFLVVGNFPFDGFLCLARLPLLVGVRRSRLRVHKVTKPLVFNNHL